MQAARKLKEKINGDGLVTGVIASFYLWPALVEIARNAGSDYMIVDLEHGPYSQELVAEVCALGRQIDFPILVRPHSNDFATVRKIMDLGPCGLLLPVVDNTKVLDEARDAIYLPPRGKRRPGGPGNRWVKNFNYQTWRDEVEDNFIVLSQIETRTGIDNAEAIAQHEITTAMAVGPYDLSADLGVCWQPEAPCLLEAIARIRRAGQLAGKNMWMIGDSEKWRDRGYNFLCVAEPVTLLEAALKSAITNVRSGADPAAAGAKYEFGDNPI